MTEAEKLALWCDDFGEGRPIQLKDIAFQLRRLSAENEALRADHARIFLFARDWAKLAGKRSDEIKRLSAQAADDTALLRQALDTLIWTTGSADFGEGGFAREGALRLLFPTIAALRERLEGQA